MDLAAFDTTETSEKGIDVQLFNPKGMLDLDVFVHVLGRDSRAFRTVQSEQNRRRVEKQMKGGIFKQQPVTLEEIDANTVELLAACTTDWWTLTRDERGNVIGEERVITVDGEKWKPTMENTTKFYKRFPAFKEQIDLKVSDRAGFIKPPSDVSSSTPSAS